MPDSHDIRKSQDLAAQEEEFVIKKAIGELKKRVFALEGDVQGTQQGVNDAFQNRIKELEEAIKHYGERLHALEEKERQRSMDKHQIELSLDEISEPVPYVPPKDGEY